MTGIAQKILSNPGAYSIEMLTKGVQDGVIPAYIGIPLIQQKTQEKSQAAGMQGAQQNKQPPIAEEVMAHAQQAAGVGNLQSNLPTQSYAPGGIVAFAGGGDTDGHGVQHFEEGGTPFGRWWGGVKQSFGEDQQKAALLTQLKNQYGPASAPVGMFMQQSDAERQAAKSIMDVLNSRGAQLTMGQLQNLKDQGITALPSIPTPGNPAASTTPTPVGTSRPGQMTTANDPRVSQAPAAPGIDQLVKKPAPTTGMGAPTNTGAGVGTGAGAASSASPFAFATAPTGKSLLDTTNEQLSGDKGYLARAAARDRDILNNLNEGKPVGKPLEDYKKSLQAEAEQAGALRDQAKGMAIFKAGLAMMSGTSQHALENIGKGAMVGADDWQVANRELIKAQKERQKELAYVEQAERAESRDDWKTAQAARANAAKSADERDRFGVSAIMTATGKDTELAHQDWQHLLGAQVNKYHADRSAEATLGAANIHAGATLGAAREHAGATRYAAELGADARVQAAELRAAVAGAAAEGKGGLTQDQLLKWRGEYANHPEVLAWKKQTLDQYGKNVVDKPEFKQALNQKIEQVLARDATRNISGSSSPIFSASDKELLNKYLAPK